MPTPLLRTALLLLAALLLQGCSAVKLAYNQADTLLYWRLDSHVDFTDEQAPRVRESLKQFHAWHRHTQLPVYADLLHRVAPQFREPISPEQACAVFDQMRTLAEVSLDPAHWPLTWLASDLSAEQLRHIERKQASNDAEWKKDWVDITPEKLAKKRYEQLLSRSEMIYGSLDDPQKAALRASLSPSSFDPRRSLAERLRRQQDLRQVLQKIHDDKPGAEAARALLKAYLDRTLQSPDAAYQAYFQALKQEGCASFSRLHNATTPAQRAKAVRTLKTYEDDFRLLATQH